MYIHASRLVSFFGDHESLSIMGSQHADGFTYGLVCHDVISGDDVIFLVVVSTLLFYKTLSMKSRIVTITNGASSSMIIATPKLFTTRRGE